MIKKASKQLLAAEHSFINSFERNKKILGSTMPSKPMRNKIAGYIARLIKMQQTEKKPKKLAIEETPQYEQY